VPVGIASGLIGGVFYNRFSTFKLPEYLAFFSGRRFVPIISGLAGLLIAGADRLRLATASTAASTGPAGPSSARASWACWSTASSTGS
jgi:hypothetical protein